MNRALVTSKRQNWGTPDAYFRRLDKILRFTLDACATLDNAKCGRFVSPEADGLNVSWCRERVLLEFNAAQEVR